MSQSFPRRRRRSLCTSSRTFTGSCCHVSLGFLASLPYLSSLLWSTPSLPYFCSKPTTPFSHSLSPSSSSRQDSEIEKKTVDHEASTHHPLCRSVSVRTHVREVAGRGRAAGHSYCVSLPFMLPQRTPLYLFPLSLRTHSSIRNQANPPSICPRPIVTLAPQTQAPASSPAASSGDTDNSSSNQATAAIVPVPGPGASSAAPLSAASTYTTTDNLGLTFLVVIPPAVVATISAAGDGSIAQTQTVRWERLEDMASLSMLMSGFWLMMRCRMLLPRVIQRTRGRLLLAM